MAGCIWVMYGLIYKLRARELPFPCMRGCINASATFKPGKLQGFRIWPGNKGKGKQERDLSKPAATRLFSPVGAVVRIMQRDGAKSVFQFLLAVSCCSPFCITTTFLVLAWDCERPSAVDSRLTPIPMLPHEWLQ